MKDTLRELFGKDTAIPTFELGSNLRYLCGQLGNHYSVLRLLNNHTLFPFYSSFLPVHRREQLIDEISNSDAMGALAKIGVTAGGICKREGIWYCPKCSENDLNKYGELNIHREHQLQGVILCPHDGCLLKKYPQSYASRLEYLRFDEKLIDFAYESLIQTNYYEKNIAISKAAYFLLNSNLASVDKHSLLKQYKNLLYDKDFATIDLRIRQNELHDSFVNYYGELFLLSLQSLPDRNDEYNWLRVITRNVARTVHPIRHILFINFLSGNIDAFFNNFGSYSKPFGNGPWPCLNKASEHYLKPIIKELTVTPDSKTRQPVGTFKCECGFIYSRRGPDQNLQDHYRIGRVKEFGPIWENRLNFLINNANQLSQNAIARELNCDPATIKKYKEKIQAKEYNTKKTSNYKISSNLELLPGYKEIILSAVQEGYSRSQIRTIFSKEYTYLYRHDKEWLFLALPPVKNIEPNIGFIDWPQRDFKILCLLQKVYNELLLSKEPVRITKTRLGKEIGELAILEHHLSKLPLSKDFLEKICESKKDFQIRRCQILIYEKVKRGKPIKIWQLQREAGLRKTDLIILQPIIEQLIKNIMENVADGKYFDQN